MEICTIILKLIKMKHTIQIIAVVVAFLTFSFTALEKDKKKVNTQTSTVTWKGYKVLGSHSGTLKISEGNLLFDGTVLTGGNFVIDMQTLAVTDLEGEYKQKLEGHLKSDDFFGVAKFSKATLEFTKVKAAGKNSYKVDGVIEIKGKKEHIGFDFSVYGNKATAALKIDRTKFDIRYGSASFFEGLKDNAIYDEFDIVVDLAF